jgi:tRNA(Arg) A34 adenosine deaminase TadA
MVHSLFSPILAILACRVTITLPEWALDYYESFKDIEFNSEEEMMTVAVEMSRRNVAENTGGPFGTAIFEVDLESKKTTLFSVGCNLVVPMSNSTLHGEMVAIQFAQQKVKTFSLAKNDSKKEYHLYTSCEPCAMCLGGTLWSGVSKMVCSAAKSDAEAIGFNEGPVFPESYDALEAAGVKVVRNVLSKEGAEVLRKYGETGTIYNR